MVARRRLGTFLMLAIELSLAPGGSPKRRPGLETRGAPSGEQLRGSRLKQHWRRGAEETAASPLAVVSCSKI